VLLLQGAPGCFIGERLERITRCASEGKTERHEAQAEQSNHGLFQQTVR
jgi:hypothetical protein